MVENTPSYGIGARLDCQGNTLAVCESIEIGVQRHASDPAVLSCAAEGEQLCVVGPPDYEQSVRCLPEPSGVMYLIAGLVLLAALVRGNR
jgi:hypothetical protein